MHAGFSLPDERLRTLSSLQNQLRQGFSSPRSVQSRSFNTNPAANMGYGQRPFTNSFVHALSQPVQGAGRLMKSSLMSKPKSHSTGLSATLFRPVVPGPRGSVWMQTYAQGRAKRVPSSGAKVGIVSQMTAARKPYLSPRFALNVAGGRPRGRLSLAAPRSSSGGVVVHELPEPFGGSAIRRLGQQTKTFIVRKPLQVYILPQWVSPYKSELKSLHPGSDWNRIKQNQRPVQMLRQISTPPRQVPVYNPDLPRVHPASTWSKIKRPYRL